MNNSKWKYLFDSLDEVDFEVEFLSIKLINEDKPRIIGQFYSYDNNKNKVSYKNTNLFYEETFIEHIGDQSNIDYKDIEWLKIKSEKYLDFLESGKIFEYLKNNNIYIFYGYKLWAPLKIRFFH
ncbi:MAG TPA: hypothetical protein PK859_02800 [Spirochaetota bacterium]|nr:hypothetical protein [Spirochaetota bacterium]HPR47242.1 hypothetical protein [Spirochaetota bacterium]